LSERLYHHRCFLNDETGAAILEALVEDDSSTHNNHRHFGISATLHITDCSRSIELSFGFSKVEEARDDLSKLDRLIDAAQGMRDTLARAAKREWPGRKF
jgi:hypothetical protein